MVQTMFPTKKQAMVEAKAVRVGEGIAGRGSVSNFDALIELNMVRQQLA